MDQDIPLLDDTITQMPTDLREDLAEMGRHNLMFFAKGVLGFRDMTERCHGPLCAWLDDNPKQFKMVLMPRDHYKTSVVTIGGTLQRVVRNPESRNLIGNESATNAERMLGSIRQHAESNRVFRALYSSVIPKDTRKVPWNNQSLTFVRQSNNPEPTIDTIGMTGAITSRHYTHMTFDDPISEEAIASEKVMKDVLNRMSAITSLLEKPERDTVWLVGTRWAFWDVYAWFKQVFSDRLGQFARSVTEDGEIIFPELISPEMLATKRKVMGPYRFSCLMMNNPRNEDVQDLNIDLVRYFRWVRDGMAVELLDDEGLVVDTWTLDQLDITVTVDPAPAEKVSSDRNAVVTCGITPRNQAIVLDVFAERCTPYRVIEHLFDIHRRFHPRVYGIEGVAYQKVLKYIVQREADRLGMYLRIEELRAPGKGKLHIRGVQPILALRRLYVDPAQHLLLQEMSEYPLGQHDDTADALGLQTQLWKGRMSPEHLERVELEAKRMGAKVRMGVRGDAPMDPEMAMALGLEVADNDEIEPLVDWDEVPIPRDRFVEAFR